MSSLYLLCVIVLPSTGVGALSAREAEGRSAVSAAEKVKLLHVYFGPFSFDAKGCWFRQSHLFLTLF